MDRYESTDVKVVRHGDEYFLVEEGNNFNPQPRLVKKLVTESVEYTMLVKRGEDYFKSRFEAGDYEVTLGTDEKDNWIRPKHGAARIRLDWQELQNFIMAHQPNSIRFNAGGLVYTTPNITINPNAVGVNSVSDEVARYYGKK